MIALCTATVMVPGGVCFLLFRGPNRSIDVAIATCPERSASVNKFAGKAEGLGKDEVAIDRDTRVTKKLALLN